MRRLKPDWTVERATAHLQALSLAIMQATLPPTYRAETAKRYLANKLVAAPAGTGVSGLRRQYEKPLWLLLATTGLVLLIACTNLANLLLARASAREHEVAVRLAIGASRGRLLRQLLAESGLLAAIGTTLGIALAQSLSRVLVRSLTTESTSVHLPVTTDWRVLLFAAGVAGLTCAVFGAIPALRATSTEPAAAMKAGRRS